MKDKYLTVQILEGSLIIPPDEVKKLFGTRDSLTGRSISDLMNTVHSNTFQETVEACAKEWGFLDMNGKWKEQYRSWKWPLLPELNTIKKV